MYVYIYIYIYICVYIYIYIYIYIGRSLRVAANLRAAIREARGRWCSTVHVTPFM